MLTDSTVTCSVLIYYTHTHTHIYIYKMQRAMPTPKVNYAILRPETNVSVIGSANFHQVMLLISRHEKSGNNQYACQVIVKITEC